MAKAARSVTADLLSIVVLSDHVVTPGPSIDFVDLMGNQGRSIVLQNDCGHAGLNCADYHGAARAFLKRD